jgi:hypothetical protein
LIRLDEGDSIADITTVTKEALNEDEFGDYEENGDGLDMGYNGGEQESLI